MKKIDKDNWSELFTIIEPKNLDVKYILPKKVIDTCKEMEMHSITTIDYTSLILEFIEKNNKFTDTQKQVFDIFSESYFHKFLSCHHFTQLIGSYYKNVEIDRENGFCYELQHNKKIQVNLKQIKFYGTIYYESFIYHLLSSIDNLKLLIYLVIPKYVRYNTRTFHKALNALGHHHVCDEEISKYLYKENELWIDDIYKVRADIYHNYSEHLQPKSVSVYLSGKKKGFNYTDTSIDMRVWNVTLSKRSFATLDEILCGIHIRLFLLFYNLVYLLYFYRKPEKMSDIINTFRLYCQPNILKEK